MILTSRIRQIEEDFQKNVFLIQYILNIKISLFNTLLSLSLSLSLSLNQFYKLKIIKIILKIIFDENKI